MNNLEIIKQIESLTKQNVQFQNKNLRFFAKADIALKLKILKEQKKIFHKLKNLNGDIDKTMLTLVSLILAVQATIKELDIVTKNAMKLRIKNIKSSNKRDKILGYWSIVKSLRYEQNMSFRQIATYFKKFHKFEVSYSLIFEIWNELENANKGEKNG